MKKIVVILIGIFSLSGVTNNAQAQVAVGVGVQVGIAPPALPVYIQPPCPVEGYLWTPGYWAYGANGYFWVPGVWLAPPRIGFLWTPGYWGFEGGHYWWHGGYWGPHVGFYGGVNYGFGYGGRGFWGGRWEGGAFRYNTAVWSVHPGFHNTYVDKGVINNGPVGGHSSFNGPGGIESRPSAEEESAMKEGHVQPTSEQQTHEHSAGTNKNQLASVNGGKPRATAMSSVKGQRYNSTGHSMNANHIANKTANNHTQNRSSAQPQHNNTHMGGAQRQAHSGGSRPAGRAAQGHGGNGRR